MVLETLINRNDYQVDGTNLGPFEYEFLVYVGEHLQVLENGVLTAKPYTVSGLGNAQGGSILFTQDPPAAGQLTLIRIVPGNQSTDYRPFDDFPAERMETDLDLSAMRDQQQVEQQGRALTAQPLEVVEEGDLYLPTRDERRNMFAAYDNSPKAKPIAAAGTSGNLGPVSVYIDGLLPKPDAAESRAYLEALENVFTAEGDLIIRGASAEQRLPIGADKQVPTVKSGSLVYERPLPPGYIEGLTLSNNGAAPTTDIDIAAGLMRSDDDSVTIVLPNGLTKKLNVAFAEGDGEGCLETAPVAADTAYDILLMSKADGQADILAVVKGASFSLPSGFVNKNRVGMFGTDGSGNVLDGHISQVLVGREEFRAKLDTTSGTTADFRVFPANTKRLRLTYRGFKLAGVQKPIVQIGDSVGIKTASYNASGINLTGNSLNGSQEAEGFPITSQGIADFVYDSAFRLSLADEATNLWDFGALLSAVQGGNIMSQGAGTRALDGVLTTVRLTSKAAPSNFDGGTVYLAGSTAA